MLELCGVDADAGEKVGELGLRREGVLQGLELLVHSLEDGEGLHVQRPLEVRLQAVQVVFGDGW